MHNLIDNAFKFSNADSAITIELRCETERYLYPSKIAALVFPKTASDVSGNVFIRQMHPVEKIKKAPDLVLPL